MEEEVNEHDLEEQFYSMLHYVDDTQANTASNQNSVDLIENAPRSTVRRYWRTNGDQPPSSTPYQKVNIPKEAPKPKNDGKPKAEKSPPAQANHLSLFQQPVPKNLRKSIEIIETENANVVELESSDEDEVIEVALPPKPTITIESSSSDEEDVTLQTTPVKSKQNGQEKNSRNGEREVSASPVPSVVSSISDEFIRGDCIALNISSRKPDNCSFDFSLHGPDLAGSTPSKKKKKKKNKDNATSTPINVDATQKSGNIEECFATPKSKAKKKKRKSYMVTEKSIPNADVYDSDSNQSVIEINKNNNPNNIDKNVPTTEINLDSNISKPVEGNKEKETSQINVDSSDSSIDLQQTLETTKAKNSSQYSDISDTITIDLTDNTGTFDCEDITENIVMANVTGFTESQDYCEETPVVKNQMLGSTKVPAILYENLDFDNLKGKEKLCKNRRYSLTSLRAEMEKFYNESWGGEDFNHREIQKSMSRDKSLWAIDPKDRMSTFSRKKFNVICNYCNRPGHRDDMCRQKPPVCYMCGNTGHVEPRCPRKICVNCGSPNQMYSTMCRNCAHWHRIKCFECGQFGHPPTHCPDLWRRYHNTIDLTPQLEENRLTKKHYQMFCSGCTRRGHLVHTCRISLPFSGLPINSPYVNIYRPIYTPQDNTDQNQRNQQKQFRPSQQDDTVSFATKEAHKRQSKSPTAHETHVNKKRNLSMSDFEVTARQNKSPSQDTQRKRSHSQSKETTETPPVTEEQGTTPNVPETVEKAPDFIPLISNNHDKRGQVIQDNEVSDTSDVITSARIYVTNDVIGKLKTKEGEDWLKETADKLNIIVENTDFTSFLSIKGKVGDQEAFQSAIRDWTKPKPNIEHAKSDSEADTSQLSENDKSFINNIPKKRNDVIRKLNNALESLKNNIGEPNELFKELNYLQNRHQKLLSQKVVNSQQLTHNRDYINVMLMKLNMILLGQAGLAGGQRHIRELYTLQSKLINFRQKNISAKMRAEIGEHFHSIFSSIPRDDYGQLIKSYNFRKIKLPMKKKNKSFSLSPKMKKFNTIPQQNQQARSPGAEIKPGVEKTKSNIITAETPRNFLVEKTMNKLVFYHRRLMQARPIDAVLNKTRVQLAKKLKSQIASFSKTANTTSKNLKKIKKLQEQAQLFLNNV